MHKHLGQWALSHWRNLLCLILGFCLMGLTVAFDKKGPHSTTLTPLVGGNTVTEFQSTQEGIYIDTALEDLTIPNYGPSEEVFHLFSHGKPGHLYIEGVWKDVKEITLWFYANKYLENKAHLNIYGCEFAKGLGGKMAVDYLQERLGVTIAASDDTTGIDGDWELEVGIPRNLIQLPDYQGNLQSVTNTGNNSGVHGYYSWSDFSYNGSSYEGFCTEYYDNVPYTGDLFTPSTTAAHLTNTKVAQVAAALDAMDDTSLGSKAERYTYIAYTIWSITDNLDPSITSYATEINLILSRISNGTYTAPANVYFGENQTSSNRQNMVFAQSTPDDGSTTASSASGDMLHTGTFSNSLQFSNSISPGSGTSNYANVDDTDVDIRFSWDSNPPSLSSFHDHGSYSGLPSANFWTTSGMGNSTYTLTISFSGSDDVTAIGFDMVHINQSGGGGDKITISALTESGATITPTYTQPSNPDYILSGNVADAITYTTSNDFNLGINLSASDSDPIASVSIGWAECSMCSGGYHGVGMSNLEFNVVSTVISPSQVEASTKDTDGDGIIDTEDLDDDNDGILDEIESCGSVGTVNTASITIDVKLDKYPSETSWTLKDASGSTVLSGGNYGNSDKNSLKTASLSNASGAYTFTIADQYGDGTCCNYGSGYYEIKVDGTTVVGGSSSGNGNFGASKTETFSVGSSGGFTCLSGDPSADDDGDQILNYQDADFCTLNANGVCTSLDQDGDGIINQFDIDSDGDGITDNTEAQATASYVPPSGADSDNDGIDNAYDSDAGGTPLSLVDTDADNTADYLDTDSDGDGINDNIEGHDSDGNGAGDSNSPANTGIASGTDTDRDGLDDGFDNNTSSWDASNTNLNPSSHPIQAGADDRRWRTGPLAEICNNGIDDDGDGYMDCADADCGVDTDSDGIADCADLDDDNDGIPDELECLGNSGNAPVALINGDFEEPLLNSSWAYFDEGSVAGWNTTGTDNKIELWQSGFSGIDSYTGGQHAEINATQNAALYQDIATTPGNTMVWYFSHRGRGSSTVNDSMRLLIGPGSGSMVKVQRFGTTNSSWAYYSGTYIVPDGQTSTRFQYEAISTASGNASIGNFIDKVGFFSISSCPVDTDGDGIANSKDLDSDNDGIPDLVEAGGTDANNDGLVDNATDTDGDGLADLFDNDDDDGILVTGCTYPTSCNLSGSTSNLLDKDNDGTNEETYDIDGDGLSNWIDIDSDGDGITDYAEAQATDSFIAKAGTDDDNDGIDNAFDANDNSFGGANLSLVDTDSDGINDFLDTNSDGDSLSDLIEGHDTDGDGSADNNSPSNTGIASNTDTDNDGLDDGFDNNTSSWDATNGNLSPSSHPKVFGGEEADWRYVNLDADIVTIGLDLWLDASDLSTLFQDVAGSTPVTASAQNVALWKDKSGNGHDLSQATSDKMPVFRSAVSNFNNKSAIDFAGDDFVEYVMPSAYQGPFTIFIALQSDDDSPVTNDAFFASDDVSTTSSFQIDYDGSNNFRAKFKDRNTAVASFGSFESNDLKLFAIRHDGTQPILYNDGAKTDSVTTSEGTYFDRYKLNINRVSNRYHDSHIAEVIVYHRALTDCEILENNYYLGLKYGRDFFDIKVNYDFANEFPKDINGIGRLNTSCLSTPIDTLHSDILSIYGASSNDTQGEYITVGNDGKGNTLKSLNHSTYTQCLNQTWKADEDGNLGTVTISFALEGLNINTSNASDFALLVDTDTDFSDATAITSGLSIENNKVTITGVDLNNGNTFTLATSKGKLSATIQTIDSCGPNSIVPYHMLLINNSDGAFTNITISDTLPAGFSFLADSIEYSINASNDSVALPTEGTTGVISWSGLNIPSGDSIMISYTCLVSASQADGVYTNGIGCQEVPFSSSPLQASTTSLSTLTSNPSVFTCEPAFYQVYKKKGEPNIYGKLNINTGDYDQIAVISPQANGLGYDYLSNFAYGSDGKKFIRLDEEGIATYLGIDFNKKVFVGDTDTLGNWYGKDGGDMVKIDISGPSIEARYSGQGMPGWDMAYNTDGHFYAVHNQTLYQFNTSTNSKSTIGALTGETVPSSGFGAQWMGADGYLYISNNSTGKIFRIDITSRDARLVMQSTSGLRFNDGFSCPTELPPLYEYDYSDNSNSPQARSLVYAQDTNGDNIPDYSGVWLGSKISLDNTDPANSNASGDTFDDGLSLPTSFTANSSYSIPIDLNTNISNKEVFYGLWIDWNNDHVYEDFYNGSSTISSSTTINQTINSPASYNGEAVNIRCRVGESTFDVSLVSGDIISGTGEVEDYQIGGQAQITATISTNDSCGPNSIVPIHILLINNSASDAIDFTISDTLPTGFSFLADSLEYSLNATNDSTTLPTEGNTGTISWSGLNIPAGDSIMISYACLVNSSQTNGTYTHKIGCSGVPMNPSPLQASIICNTAKFTNPSVFECQPNFYQVYKKRGEPNVYAKLNFSTGTYDKIADISPQANGLGFDYETNMAYGSDGKKFIRLDADGTTSYLGIDFNKKVFVGDVDTLGNWYGKDGGDIVMIDISGPSIVARYTGQGMPGWDMAYNMDGNFYAVHNQTLYKFSTTTNTKSTVGSLTGEAVPASGFGAQWMGSDGHLYISNNSTGKIFRINVISREARHVMQSTSGLRFNDGFSCPTEMPPLYGYDYSDNSNFDVAKSLMYTQDSNGDNIPDFSAVWAGEKVSLDSSDPSNETASGDEYDDGLTIPSSFTAGTSATINIALNTNISNKEVFYGLWIDWNNDQVFEDFYNGSQSISSSTTVEQSVNVPGDASSGTANFRLRVGETAFSNGDASTTISLGMGEVEDYQESITVTNNNPTASAGNDASICSGSNTTLNGSGSGGDGSYTYSWSPATGLSASNIASPVASPSSTTTYTLTVTDGNGLSDTDELIITVSGSITVDAGTNAGIMSGGSTTLSGSASGGDGDYSYTWSPSTGLSASNIASPTASPSSTTTYTLSVTDGTGCTGSNEVRVTVVLTPENPGGIPGDGPIIWLDASVGTTISDEGQVSAWTSQASDGGDCAQSSPESQPSLTQAGLNYRPMVSFDGANDRLLTADAHGAITTDYHFFLVMEKADERKYQTLMAYQKNDWGLLHSYGEGGGSNSYTVYSHNPAYWRWNRDGNHGINSRAQLLTAAYSKTGGGIAYFADGIPKGSHSIAPTLNHLPAGSRLVLGCRGVNGSTSNFDSHYEGNIAEVIVYNSNITETDRQKIQSYLAIKYGISLSHDYLASDGTIVWDYSAMSTYNYAICGIGKDLEGNLYQRQSISVESDAVLSISKGRLASTHAGNTGTISTDKTFLLAGNNNGSFAFDNGSIAGPSGYPCLNRVWKAIETGEVGAVDLNFDLSNFTGSNYALIVDTDGDGAFSDETPNSNVVYGPGRISFEDIDLDDGALFSLVEVPNLVDCALSFSKVSNSGIEADAESSWGASWVDYDDDGDMDLFVPDYAFWQSSRMYQNNGNGTFSNTAIGQATTDKGSNIGAQWADYDNDGDFDLLAANGVQAPNRIYKNESGILERIDAGPVDDYTGYNHSAQWVDINNDGNLDVFVADYMPTRFNNVYLGDGLGGFQQLASSISREALPTMQGVWGDYDLDGLQDLFVANTWGNDNSLFHNDGNGNFSKINAGAISTSGGSSLSAAWGDYDNDGDLDLYVANTSGQNDFLYRNEGSGSFVAVSGSAITEEEMSSQGGVWADLDNDGDLDLIVVHDNNEPISIFLNNGNGGFNLNTTDPLAQDSDKAGTAALADYDNDGDLDVFVAHLDNTADVLFANQANTCSNHWKRFKLQGTISNRSGLGAKIFVKANINNRNIWQLREVSGLNGGISAQSSIKAHFGLGNVTTIDSVKIEWPSGTIQYLTNVDVDNEQLVIEPADAMFKVITYVDINRNCNYDEGDVLLPNVEVNIQGKAFKAVTDSAGSASFNTELGTYQLEIEEQNGLTHPCWTSASVQAEAPLNGAATGNSTLYVPFETDMTYSDMGVLLSTTIMRRGMSNNFTITYYNDDVLVAENVELSVTFDPDIIPQQADIPWDRIENEDTYVWVLPSVNPFETITINVTDSISAEATLGRITNTVATFNNIPSDQNLSNNTASELEPVTAPIDPNDIQVTPEGNTDPEEILIYKIRFQNVGTFLAEKVVIKDTLPPGLDFESFEVMRSSHRNRAAVDQDGILTATFNYIMLPDSTTNEPESHGYLEFEIKPKKGIKNGTIMLNKASIYFDAEEPIVTNTVANVILYSNDYDPYDEMEEMNQPGNEGTTSEEEPNKSANNQSSTQKEGGESAYMPVMKQAEDLFVIVAPNPVLDRADVRYQAPQYEKFTMRVLNSLGQTMHQEQVIALSGVTILELYTQNWTKGYYYIQMVNKTKSATFKFVKK